MLHEAMDHSTDDCHVMCEQAKCMRETYKAQSSSECNQKHHEWKEKKTPSGNEINNMVEKQVKKSMEESFQTYMKKLGKCNCNETDSDSDSDNENYCMDEVNLDLEEVKVHEIHALSELRVPPPNHQKTNNLTPVTIVLINTQLGKSRFEKIRILFDSGSSGCIILEKYIRKLHTQNNHTTAWNMKGGDFLTSKRCKTTFILHEFYQNKAIEWNLHVDLMPGPHHYNMILGHDVMSELGITLNFKDQTTSEKTKFPGLLWIVKFLNIFAKSDTMHVLLQF